jgi:hypothetical protein
MIKQEFIEHTKTVRSWIIAMIASWDDDLDKITNLLMKYVGTPEQMNLFDKKVDSWFIAQFQEMNIIGINGTKNNEAWISNLDGFGKYFHDGIFDATHDTILQECPNIKNIRKNTLISGQSRGGLIALFLNYLLKGQGYENVESFGFANPFGTTDAGKENMHRLGIRHTNFVTDPFGSLPSDPTDDVGVIRGGHYGHVETLYGGAGVFDHSYLNITYKLIAWFLKQYNEKHEHKCLQDAIFLAGLIEKGNDLIKK